MARTETIDLGYRPRPWQQAMHRGRKRFSVLVVHRRGGKTLAAIMELIDAALRDTTKSGRYIYLSPLLKQSKAVSWDYLRYYSMKVPRTKINESELSIEFANGSRIRLYGADNPDSLRGIYVSGCVLDEVAQMKPEVWGEILRPALADRDGWCIFIGTPKGTNLFSDLYYRACQEEDWFAGMYTINDTEALDEREVATMRAEMTENQYRQEMLCDFSASTDDTLISIELVEAATSKALHESAYNFAPKILGVDVARYGGDRSVIFPRQGLAAFKPKIWQSIDNMALAGHVARAIDTFEADACFIDSGRGEGVIDRLLQLGYSPIPVDFGGRPNNPKYVNKRAEMWDLMAAWLKEGGSLPSDQDLRRDLCTPTFSYANAAGKFALESKDKIKERGMPSPDIADALCTTFAHPVQPKGQAQKQQHAESEYDPRRIFAPAARPTVAVNEYRIF